MLAALAVNWAFLLLRVTIAIVFGIVALAWPGLRLTGVALLFGAYAVADGALALVVAFGAKGVPGFGSLLFEAFVRLGVGLVALKSPAAVALVMVRIFAAWAILSGIAAIAAAVALRRDLTGEWPLPFAGGVSILMGSLLLGGVGASLEMKWVVGPYTIIFALTLLALTLRLRQLALEMSVS